MRHDARQFSENFYLSMEVGLGDDSIVNNDFTISLVDSTLFSHDSNIIMFIGDDDTPFGFKDATRYFESCLVGPDYSPSWFTFSNDTNNDRLLQSGIEGILAIVVPYKRKSKTDDSFRMLNRSVIVYDINSLYDGF